MPVRRAAQAGRYAHGGMRMQKTPEFIRTIQKLPEDRRYWRRRAGLGTALSVSTGWSPAHTLIFRRRHKREVILFRLLSRAARFKLVGRA